MNRVEGLLRVADLAGLVDLLAGEADVGGYRRRSTPNWNAAAVPSLGRHLTPLLRRIVLVREPALGLRLRR